ncbi:MAG: transglutaminase-like domain-containing protein [Lachnospiraceae bacterium]|nr:transglutaminase-like domain-containing protein [Lachnospiraceae bacterium]
MKKFFSIILFILIIVLSGCSDSPQEIPRDTSVETPAPVDVAISETTPSPPLEAEDVPTAPGTIIVPEPEPEREPVRFEIPEANASGTNISENDKVLLDFSNSSDGYIMIKFLEETNRDLRVRLTFPAGGNHLYVQRADGDFGIYPLSEGSGDYMIEVFQGAGNGAYTTVLTESIKVELVDEFTPFIRPNYYVNYNENNAAIKHAWDLTKGKPEELEKIAAVYKYVTENITYDMEFAKSVKAGYVPDIDSVMKNGTGICFDYAVLMAAMLRSQGIPTKLVFGYVGTVYHAWINVYTKESGWVDGVIFFDGSKWILMDPTFASSLLDDTNSLEQFIGDGSNYDVKFLF